ncbi:MAG TPA: ATP-binding protein [Desulfobacter sp.]|uniref:AAA family ATPase n=1 Tax=Desulfobacter sp. UBA2225 TaxID=1961413 RepID=UPI000E9107A4|nr:AAA family ATPase [Desulfobacter sp. UBA2225]HAR32898.1 ATP-binding protein [Desulfobacter sp.]
MLKEMAIKNLTVFSDSNLKFSKNLNVIVGENGTGKTHLLKMVYSIVSVCTEGSKPHSREPTKASLQVRIADKLIGVFRPESLGRLARRKQGRERCDVQISFFNNVNNVAFSFATNSKTEVSIETLPQQWGDTSPVYLPTRELLTIYPNFVSVYEGHYLEFEETWRDACLLLGTLIKRGPTEKVIRELLSPLEEAMEGSIELDKSGRFYLKNSNGRMEMPLVAEGLRKLGMLARLIATGVLMNKGYLFWDEPEANLNPRLITRVAKSILDLSNNGIQIFIATHSLFLLRELEILLSQKKHRSIKPMFFGLHKKDDEVSVLQGPTMDDIGDIASLDEELEQSDRFLKDEN